jgi:hypothetical protein
MHSRATKAAGQAKHQPVSAGRWWLVEGGGGRRRSYGCRPAWPRARPEGGGKDHCFHHHQPPGHCIADKQPE